ncbi:signal peptidase I [Treponema pedis]|uniref:Signal peptidase I n=1 Tax=Treponema pedis TaxID=409322 RepID=A0A7S6WSP5_9SPIR|nr:signal peptidase I [Treponema pedis]QOW62087.1 signal peptidase I [Treponema pedis]
MGARYRDYSYTAKLEHRRKVLFICFIFIFIFSVYTVITSFLIRPYRIQSDSMKPEIALNDIVLTTPIYNPFSTAKRGSLVVITPSFNDKRSFFQKTADGIISFFTFQLFKPFEMRQRQGQSASIRRIIGMPGDTIYMENFILHIKTAEAEHFLTEFELTETDYNLEISKLPLNWNAALPFSGSYPKITLKENEYFVLCDNRLISDDSRMWGPLDGKVRIYGSLLLKYWPLKKIKLYKGQ